MSDPAGEEIKIEVDEASLQESMSQLRGLMREVNSVRGLIYDTQRLAKDPSLINVAGFGMQLYYTTSAVSRFLGPEMVSQLSMGIGLALGTPVGAATAFGIGAVAVVGGLALYNYNQEQDLRAWEVQQRRIAKSQGLEP